MHLIFATNNQHKLEEVIAAGTGFSIKGLKDMGIFEEIPEPHETLEENAIEKATFISKNYNYNCFADDTGLEIEALNGKPGVYSARYAGLNCSFQENVEKVLKELQGITNRKARFRTIIALSNNNKIYTFEGIVEGSITEDIRGKSGFGYDPIFLPDNFKETFAEMDLGIKNKISHRGKALEKFIYFLKSGKY